ncbi:MAG: hypothetical protein ACK5LS_11140 [Propioniciclava sp.]
MHTQGDYHGLRDVLLPGYKIGKTLFNLRDDLKATLRQASNRKQAPPDDEKG